MRIVISLLVSIFAAPVVPAQDFLPVAVWYGGGKARAPMLEREPARQREAWRRDLQQIKALGFNTVRMWADWASTEPERGRYRLEYVDQMLDLAEEAGLKVIIQIYTDSAPEWLAARYPDAAFVTHTGMRIVSQASPGFCLDHPGVREDVGRFISAVAERVRNRRAFYAWDLWSEPHIVNWVWMNFPVEFCWCPYTQQKFREWLRERYGGLGKLNAAWYRTFSDWKEVEAPRYGTILSYTDFMDWKAFVADKIEGDLRLKADAVRRVRGDFLTTSHSDVPGVLTSPLNGYGNGDDWHMYRTVNFYGTSLYPKHASATQPWEPVRLAAALDGTYSASGARGFYVGELQAGQGATGVRVGDPVTAADLRLWALAAIAHGARAINYYAWYPMSSGYESNGYGMIELDGTLTERSKEAGRVARVLAANAALILGAWPRRAEVGIVYNPLAYLTGGNTIGPGRNVRDSLIGTYRAFYERNIPAEFVHTDQLSVPDAFPALARFRALYLPYPLVLTYAAARSLKEYVRAGGTLVSEARPAWNDERGFAHERIPGAGLDEVFGAREALLRSPETTEFAMAEDAAVPGMKPGEKVKGYGFEEHLAVSTGAAVLAHFAGGEPAVTSARFGLGRAVLIGSFVGMGNEKEPGSAAGRLLVGLAEQAGVKPPVEITGAGPLLVPSQLTEQTRGQLASSQGQRSPTPDTLPERVGTGLEARLMQGRGYRLLFLLNHAAQKQAGRVSIPDAPANLQGRDLFTGERRSLPLDFSLEARGTLVLELR